MYVIHKITRVLCDVYEKGESDDELYKACCETPLFEKVKEGCKSNIYIIYIEHGKDACCSICRPNKDDGLGLIYN